jgi:hypothetical protein
VIGRDLDRQEARRLWDDANGRGRWSARLVAAPSPPLPAPFQRVYFHHIRRVGGTSLSESFLALSGTDGAEAIKTLRAADDQSLVSNGIRYVGANPALLEAGAYFYGSSHLPAHKLTLPPNTFRIAILRHPVDRIVSNYRAALFNSKRKRRTPFIELESSWLGDSLSDFCRDMPRWARCAQLYAFSSSFDVNEAAAVIAGYDCVFLTEHYGAGLARLSTALRLSLVARHAHQARLPLPVARRELREVERLLEEELELLEQVRRTVALRPKGGSET